VAALYGDFSALYTSSDFGATWAFNSLPNNYWKSMAASADGRRLTIAGSTSSGLLLGPAFSSEDFGLTWVSNNVPPLNWLGVASSADGNLRAGVTAVAGQAIPSGTGSIWISRMTSAPPLSITLSQSAVLVSWTIPSTDFVLQRTSDLVTGQWSDVSDAPVVDLSTLQKRVSQPLSPERTFFRLRIK
jgi:hypothetical protein